MAQNTRLFALYELAYKKDINELETNIAELYKGLEEVGLSEFARQITKSAISPLEQLRNEKNSTYEEVYMDPKALYNVNRMTSELLQFYKLKSQKEIREIELKIKTLKTGIADPKISDLEKSMAENILPNMEQLLSEKKELNVKITLNPKVSENISLMLDEVNRFVNK